MRNIEEDRSIIGHIDFRAWSHWTWAVRAIRDYMTEVEALRAELGETNEALAACQAQASGEIRMLRERVRELEEGIRDCGSPSLKQILRVTASDGSHK